MLVFAGIACSLTSAQMLHAQVANLGLPVQISADCGGCPIPIERLMREFQARKDATGDERSQWPPAECGESKLPAPPFPPDGFYGGMLCDPRLMAQLVAAVNYEMRQYTGYSKFVDAEDGQLPEIDGEEVVPDPWRLIPEVLFNGIEHPQDVNASNYCQVADKLHDVIEHLRYVVIADVTTQGGNGGNGQGGFSTLGTGKSCLITVGGTLGNECAENCGVGTNMAAAFSDCMGNSISNQTTSYLNQLGFREQALYSPCPGPNNEEHCYCETLARSHLFGPLTFDSGQQRGRGHLYLKVGPPQEDAAISNRPPMSESYMEKFRHYGTFDIPATGLNAWSRAVQGSPYGFTMVSGHPVEGVSGWKVDTDDPIVAVLDPYYNRKPDEAASGGCASCLPGKVTASLGGVHVKISLGQYEMGTAGYIMVRGDTLVGWGEEMVRPDSNGDPIAGLGAHELRTPAGVSYHGPSATLFTVNEPYKYLRQVRGTSVNVNIVPSTNGFTVSIYRADPADWLDTESGLLIVEGPLLKTVAFEHAMSLEDDPASTDPADMLSIGTLTITEGVTEIGVTKFTEKVPVRPDFEVVDDLDNRGWGTEEIPGAPNEIRPDFLPASHGDGPRASASVWELASGVDSLGVALRRERVEHTLGSGARTEVRTLLDASDGVAFKEQREYTVSASGDSHLVSRQVFTDGQATEETTVATADVSEGLFHTAVEGVTEWGGRWEAYEYDETTGRVTKVVTQHLGNEYSEALNHVTLFNYYSVDLSNDTDSAEDFIVEKIEKLMGTEVARSYTIYWSLYSGRRETSVVRCTALGSPSSTQSAVKSFLEDVMAEPLASAHMATHTIVGDGEFDSWFRGRSISRLSPDGTVTLYAHEAVAEMNWTGVPAEPGTGLEVTTGPIDPVSSSASPVGGTLYPRDGTRSVTIKSAAGTVLLSQSWDIRGTHQPGNWTEGGQDDVLLSKSTTMQRDAHGRAVLIEHADGSQEVRVYDCCGLVSETDRGGSMTTYTYDELKRVIRTLREIPGGWLATEYDYDAAGNVIEERRVPYAGGQPGTAIVTRRSTYDLSGRLIAEEDALGNTTTYEREIDQNGMIVETTTLPDPDYEDEQNPGPLDSPVIVTTTYPDGSMFSVGGTGAHPVSYEYGVYTDQNTTLRFTTEKRGSAGTQWVKTYADALGRTVWTEYPGSVMESTEYDVHGNAWRQIDADGVTTLTYSGYGEDDVPSEWTDAPTGIWDGRWTLSVHEIDPNGVPDFDGTDRITLSRSELAQRDQVWVRRSTTIVWTTNGDEEAMYTTGVTDTTLDGLCAWHEADGQITETVATLDWEDAERSVVSIDAAGGQYWTMSTHGFEISTQRFAPDESPAGGSLTYYDEHGRVDESRMVYSDQSPGLDAVTEYTYDDLDRVVTTTDPEPEFDEPYFGRRVTTTTYDNLGRVIQVEHPEGRFTYSSYAPTGELVETYGYGVNPVRYEYDEQGRLKKLKTYKDTSGTPWTGEAITTWNYSSTRGWLTSKTYQGGGGPSYLYTDAGRVSRKTNQRNIQANYTYDDGQLIFINYNDDTQDVTLTYDRLGRLATVIDAAGERTFAYDNAGRMLGEEITTASGSPGLLWGVEVTNTYDGTTKLRTSHTVERSTLSRTVNYGYDDWRRLDHVQKDTLHARFAYHPVTGQVVKTTYIHNDDDPDPQESPVVVGDRTFDRLGRLKSIHWTTNTLAETDVASAAYEHDAFGRRIKMTTTPAPEEGVLFWEYGYDDLNQLTGAQHYWTDGEDTVTIPGEKFGFGYDEIGNRLFTQEGGDDEGQDTYLSDYTSNLLNQYTLRDVSGNVEVVGRTSSGSVAAVTVNSSQAWLEHRMFHKRLTFNNFSDPVVGTVNVLEVPGLSSSSKVFLPEDPEEFWYDDDGNLTRDGVWHYEWDAENRLKAMQMRDEVAQVLLSGSNPWTRIEFRYDWMGRRISKMIQTTNDDPAVYGTKTGPPITWGIDRCVRYVWDGWHLSLSYRVQGNGAYLGPDQSFAWGPDLSSGYGGAGGIGGLVAYCDDDFDTNNPTNDPDLGPMYPIYDGNGNVVRMCRFAGVSSGGFEGVECRTAAAYEYGPFGEALSVTGEDLGPAGAGGQGQRNPFRFSTKYTDAETGLVYYGYRYYSPGMGRWVSRDPIGEAAGFNLAGFVVNNPTNFIDPWGLQVFRAKDTAIISYLTTVAVPGLAALLQAMNVPWFFDGSREEAAVVRARILAIQNVLVPGMNQTTNAAPPINIGTRPGALWWDTSKEHRGYILMTPWIRCDCQRVAAYGVTNQESDPGYTPARLGITTLYSAGEWHPTNRGAVSSTVVRVDEAMESVSFTQRGSSRVGGAGGWGFTQVVGRAPPFVWRDISFTIKCNGEASIEYSGSNLPNHAAYYDGRRIGRAAQEADSTPFFRHGPTEYTGSVFKTHHIKLPRDD